MANIFTGGLERLFGWSFKDQGPPTPLGLVPKEDDDGSVAAIAAPASGVFGTVADIDNNSIRNDADLILRYREMAGHPEIDAAIEEITCEAIASQGTEPETVKIILDDLKSVPPKVKLQIEIAFAEIMQMLDIRHNAYNIFRRWYIDGRLYFQVIIDEKNPELGIKEFRLIDARKIRKIRELEKVRIKSGSGGGAGSFVVLNQVKNEYFVYTDTSYQTFGMNSDTQAAGPNSGLKIAKDAILYITSGLPDSLGSRILSYLHMAIKPLNQLRILEDSAVIFRMSRAPERRVWKIEVGNLPKMKAEQFVHDMMTRHKNRLNYNQATGEILDQRKFQTILEDYWLPTRDGVGTQVQVLPPGTGIGTADIEYFLKKLYASLKVPTGRLDPDNQLQFAGAATSISRDEIKFGKFIARLRVQFSQLFLKALEKQLVLKNVMELADWEQISPYVRFDFIKDNYFMEIKDQQVMQARADLCNNYQPFVGLYYSHQWIKKNILRQSDAEIEQMAVEIQMEGPPVVYTDQGGGGAPPDQGAPEGEAPRSGKSMVMGGDSPRNIPDMRSMALQPGFKNVAKLLSKGT